MPAPTGAPALRTVARHRAAAEADLVAATGGASLCRTDLAPDAKRAEGALAAIAQVHRGVRRGAPTDPALMARTALDEWIAARTAAVDLGRAWRDYRDGGVAALRALLAELEDGTAR